MELTFWGAARTVTGSMHLLTLANGTRILLDCGLFQGDPDEGEALNRDFPCDPAELDYLILSHAHIDHCGNIPQLVKRGFRGPIFCTHATYNLCSIMLQDSAQIQESDAERETRHRKRRGQSEVFPLYTTQDAEQCLESFITLPYGKWNRLNADVDFLFLDAGHMLGSASVTLRIREDGREVTLGFTGDVGRPHRPILKDPVPMPPVDYLISESTYGGREHEEAPEALDHLLAIIHRTCVEKKGKLLIPAFAVGRTQDVVHALDKLERDGRLPRIPVYVDSPLAVDATHIYEMHPECFDQDMIRYLRDDPNPFGFARLHYVRNTEESKRLNTHPGPAIIIASSGMMNAGRILHHLKHSLGSARHTVLVVGHCSQNTLGARILRGDPTVRIHGQEVEVHAEVERLPAYSAHAGHSELYEFIRSSQKPDTLKKLFLVHGEEENANLFADHMRDHGFQHVYVPERGDHFSL